LQTYTNIDVSRLESVKDVIKKPQRATLHKSMNPNNLEFGYWSVVTSDIGISAFEKKENVRYVGPVFLSGGQVAPLSNIFYIELKEAADTVILKQLAEKYSIDVLGSVKFMPLWFRLSSDKNSVGNTLQMANALYETGKFSEMAIDLLTNDLNCVNDPFFVQGHHWNLNGTFGINYCAARAITTGSPNIIVAVLDQGIEKDHPNIVNLHHLSYDSETQTSPSQLHGHANHGTPVAGIIGASSNNGLGTTGIASNCRLMDISNSMTSSIASREARAVGINWAWKNGADVINNSWSFSEPFPLIDRAIDSALTFGRNGKGAVVVFVSGNNDTSVVNHPARSDNRIIVVGAMTKCGTRATHNSCNVAYWGSNYGDALDVVAPGVEIPTTGLYGSHNNTFERTSSATPHVSAVAALILSINPSLTQGEVASIIKTTAQKVRTDVYTYSHNPNRPHYGTWNNQMGHGLVDAGAAVRMAFCGSPAATVSGTINTNRTAYGSSVNTSGTTTVPFNRKLTLKGCNSVTLNEGFTVESGAALEIRVGP
jgi:subtilisin family serine protease